MPNNRIATLLTERLPGGLWHPGDPAADQQPKLIPLPGLASSGIPPEMAEQFAQEAGLPSANVAQLVAEAIVNVIETDGASEIVPRVELEQLRARAAELEANPPAGQMVTVCCHCSPAEPLAELSLGRPQVMTSGAALRKRIDEVCKCPT